VTLRLTLAASALALAVAGPVMAHPVTIKRDSYGIPHVYAQDAHALFYGYGYALAEDRLFQMEMVRRSAEGTVAQVLGPKWLETDRSTRTMLDPASLRRQMQALTPGDRAMFDGLAAGMNARIAAVMADKAHLMPREFITKGFEPQRWSGYDVAAVWVGLILNRFFSGNMELANLKLHDHLVQAKGADEGERIYRQLRWLEDPTAPTIDAHQAPVTGARDAVGPQGLRPVSDRAALAYQHEQQLRLGIPAAAGMPTASNAWVIAPQRSTAGHTVLYNGPQQGWFSPSIVYGIGLHGAGFDMTGYTPVGLPALFFGTNGVAAWGSTVGALDTNDLYQEELVPGQPHSYRFKGQVRAMTARREVIHVKGAPDDVHTAYATVHGPVTGWDAQNNTAYALKRSWAGHELETLMGWAHVGQAKSWDGFLKQASRVSASITWFYADRSGTIGYAGLGLLPHRPANQPVQFPAKGDGSMEWLGTLPFAANPKQHNPAQGYLVSWNNKTAPGVRGDGADYSAVDRVNELAAAIRAQPKLDDEAIWHVDRMGAQADLNHRYFKDAIAQAVAGLAPGDPVRRAGEIIAAWDGQLHDTQGSGQYDGAGPALFHAWLPIMLERLMKADLPADVFAHYGGTGYLPSLSPQSAKPGPGAKQVWYALQQGRHGEPFAYDFLHGRDPAALIREALGAAVASLTARQGADMGAWREPVAAMQFSPDSALGVPWADADEGKRVAPYRNRGTISLRVTLGKEGTHMCSALPPGKAALSRPMARPTAIMPIRCRCSLVLPARRTMWAVPWRQAMWNAWSSSTTGVERA
jgi:penicillin amidase